MVTPGELLKDVTFRDEAAANYAASLVLDAELGFLRRDEAEQGETIDLVGFGRQLQRAGGDRWRDGRLVPPIMYFELADEEKDPRKLLKAGVASRVYNTPHALGNTLENPNEAPVWALQVPQARLLDERRPSDATVAGKVRRAASYAVRLGEAKLLGLDCMTMILHKRYINAAAVIFNEPPHAEVRSAVRHNDNPTGLTPAFLAICDE